MNCTDVMQEAINSYWRDEQERNFPRDKDFYSPYQMYELYFDGVKFIEELKPSYDLDKTLSAMNDPMNVYSDVAEVVTLSDFEVGVFEALCAKFITEEDQINNISIVVDYGRFLENDTSKDKYNIKVGRLEYGLERIASDIASKSVMDRISRDIPRKSLKKFYSFVVEACSIV